MMVDDVQRLNRPEKPIAKSVRPRPRMSRCIHLTVLQPQQLPDYVPPRPRLAPGGADDFAGLLVRGFEIYSPPLHSSNIRADGRCAHYTLLRERLGLHPRGSYSSPLAIGGVTHEILAELYRGAQLKTVWEARYVQLQKDITSLRGQINSLGVLEDGSSPDALAEKATEDFWKGVAIAANYEKLFPTDHERFKFVAVEQVVNARVKGLTSVITGAMDILALERATNRLWIIDHKTTTSDAGEILAAAKFDLQPQIYRILATALHPDLTIAGVIHNIIQKPTIKFCPDTKDKGGIQDYIARVYEWYAEKIEAAKIRRAPGPLLRSEVPFPPGGIPKDVFSLMTRTSRRLRGKLSMDKYPKCSDMYTCTHWIGQKPCEFLGLCAETNPGAWAQQVATRYVQDHRDYGTQETG